MEAKRKRIETEVEVRGSLGLHARPAARLAQALKPFKAEVYLSRGNRRVNARSILDVLTLAAPAGTRLTVIAEGEEADEAVKTLREILEAEV